MRKLFDEAYESTKTRIVWYGYFDGEFDERLKENIVHIVREDLLAFGNEGGNELYGWVFYCDKISTDAIADSVRKSIKVRHWNGRFSVHPDATDHQFVTGFDDLERFREGLEKSLNK